MINFGFLPDEKEYRWRKNTGGGALFDIGCYFVNLSRNHFVKCIRKEKLLPPAEDGVLNMRAMEQLYRSTG